MRAQHLRSSSTLRVTLYTVSRYRNNEVRGDALKAKALPSQNIGRDSEIENFSTQGDPNDNKVCKQILESDPVIRVAAFIEGAEVTGYAETSRTRNVLSQSGELRKKVGFWVSIVTEMARQTDKLFGNTEYVCVTHKGLKMVTVPLSGRRSLGLSLDRSADPDKIIPKIMAKFSLGPTV
jgi:hypothetical protein